MIKNKRHTEKMEMLFMRIKSLLTEEEQRMHLQFTYVFGALAVISFVMTVMNIFTDYRILMLQTAAFTICNIINLFLEISRNKTLTNLSHILFSVEFIALLTSFIYIGEPEGFSAIWAALLPTAGILILRAKWGTIISFIQFVIIAFSFWTPVGQSLLPPVYTDPFKMRFPVLYLAFFAVGIFFEIVRSSSQAELEKARDLYRDLYTEEGIKASEERKKNLDIIRTLATAYVSVFYVNLDDGLIDKYTLSDGNLVALDVANKFDDALSEYAEMYVYKEDADILVQSCLADSLRQQLADKKTYKVTYRAMVNGNPRYYELKFVKVGRDGDAPNNIVAAFSDIDHIVREEMEKQNELERAMREAQVASEAKTRFLFNMSHDIRTPMNAIIGFADMCRKYSDDKEKVEDCLNKIKISGDHLLHLINDVLDMSKIDNGKVEIDPRDSDIHECGSKLCSIVNQSAAEKNLTFELSYSNITEPFLRIDVLRMNQILINIIGNSVKYTPAGGFVKCLVSQKGLDENGRVITEFVIADNGIGMKKEFLEHVFDSFSRERSSTVSKIQGTGLGMTITKRLVELMDGSISVESEENLGTRVTVIVAFEKASSAVSDKSEELSGNQLPEGCHKTILLVEDNAFNREIAEDILSDTGLTVETADDGNVAVDIIRNHPCDYYDLVLMDIQMPTMDGYEATKEIRSLGGGYLNIPIIALTANAFEEDRKMALQSGMNGHLSKPIDTEKLFELIRKL